MLCIIFTKRKLLAGIKTNSARLLDIKGRTHFNYEPSTPHEVLATHLESIGQAYTSQAKKDGQKVVGAIPTSVAFPVDLVDEAEKSKIIEVINSSKSIDLEFVHADNLVVSFMHGLPERDKLSENNIIILEAMDDYTHLCYQDIDPNRPSPNLKEHGKAALFQGESFDFIPFKDFGTLAGNDRVLSELMAECSIAGLSVDFKGQAQLARQLEEPNPSYRYLVSKQTDSVHLEAEVSLKPEQYEELLLVNKDKLGEKFSTKELEKRKVKNIILIGGFLRTSAFKNYLDSTLKLGDMVHSLDLDGSKDEFSLIVNGLANRTEEVLEAERIMQAEKERKRLEAEKRAKIAAELKVKEDRDSLLAEIASVCTDPSKQDEYEAMFMDRAAKLGIPDMVVRWNITEVLGKIELQKEGEGVGLYTTHEKSEKGLEFIAEEETQEEAALFSSEPEPEKEEEQAEETTKEEDDLGYSDEELLASLDEVLAKDDTDSVLEDLELDSLGEPDQAMMDEINDDLDAITEEEINTKNDEKPSAESKQTSMPQAKETVAAVEVMEEEVEEKEEEAEDEIESEKEKLAEYIAPAIDKSIIEKPISDDVFALEMEKMSDIGDLPKELEKEPVSSNGNHGSATKIEAVKVKDKVEDSQIGRETQVAKFNNVKNLDAAISLSDLFSIKGTLPDIEFSTKKVMMVGDQELKAVRVLAAADVGDPDKLARFKKLHKKELSYYPEMSEITEAKEGLFYFRPYLERSTLKSYVKKSGLDNKMDIDELSSTDLKFILQVFKEIRELPTGHADLSEDNILVISKRKWNLQKNMEIKVVGFTSESATAEQMLERTHEVFSGLLGDAFYQDFREKFQL